MIDKKLVSIIAAGLFAALIVSPAQAQFVGGGSGPAFGGHAMGRPASARSTFMGPASARSTFVGRPAFARSTFMGPVFARNTFIRRPVFARSTFSLR